jgi:hypothetical protein
VTRAGQDALPFDLLEILARERERLEAALGRWTVRDRELEAGLGDLELGAASATFRLTEAEAQRDAALAEHERRAAEEDERLARLQAGLEEAPAAEVQAFELDEPEPPTPVPRVTPISGGGASRRAPVALAPAPSPEDPPTPEVSWRGIGPFAYWPLIALIVIGEIPLNAFAFRLFHEPDLLTYVMTVTVAVGLVAFAHALGLLLSRPERTRVERVLVGVFVALPVAAIAVISLVRYGYLLDVGGDSGIGPVLGMLAFGLINLLVFGAATGLSYLHHDPRTLVNQRAAVRAGERERARAERRAAEQERERRSRELRARTARHAASIEARRRESSGRREQVAEAMRVIREAARERVERLNELHARVDAARAALGQAQHAVEALATERRALREATDAELRAIRAHRDRLVYAYCSANVRAREGHEVPECLQAVPPLELPAEFRDPRIRAA